VTQVIVFEGNGVLDEFGGGYDDWLRYSKQKQAEKAVEKKETSKPPVKKAKKSNNTIQNISVQKLSSNEKKELESLPALIDTLESEQADINQRLTDADIYREQPELVKTLQSRLSAIEIEIEEKLARWEALDQLT
jgi:ATP-binding cassette subfamily F protein uup